MSTQVGSLYTSLTLESASFLSNMKRAADSAEQGAARIDAAFGALKTTAIGFVSAITVDAIGGLVTRGLDYASSLGEVSQQLGVTSKDLQVYRYAATQVGISQEEIEKGLQKLTKSIGENNKGFAELGIKTVDTNGHLRSTGDVFRDLADKIGGLSDPAARAKYEVELFGKAGQNLDTILTEGAKGIDSYAQVAARFGIVLDDAAITKADAAADKMSELNQVLSVNIARTVADNADAILALADAIEYAAGAAGRGITITGDYIRGIRSLAGNNPIGLVKGLLFDDASILAAGQQSRVFADIMAGNRNLSANGLPGFSGDRLAGVSSPAETVKKVASRAAPAARAAADPRAGINALLADPARLSDAFASLGASAADTLARLDGSSQSLADTLGKAFDPKVNALDDFVRAIPNLNAGLDNLIEAGNKFADDLSRGLGESFIYSQSIGGALVNSIKAATAQLITSGLLDLLKGAGGSGGVFGAIASGIGGLFGGARASGGPVDGNKAYLVGERGPELLVGASGRIIPNDMLRRASNDNGRNPVNVTVDVQPSPLFVTTVAAVSAQAGRGAAAEQVRQANRPRLAGGRG